MTAKIPVSARTIMCEWEMVKAIFPAGTDTRDTKTYVHRNPRGTAYSIIRLIDGEYAGHMILTQTELHSLGDVA